MKTLAASLNLSITNGVTGFPRVPYGVSTLASFLLAPRRASQSAVRFLIRVRVVLLASEMAYSQ